MNLKNPIDKPRKIGYNLVIEKTMIKTQPKAPDFSGVLMAL